MACGYLNKSAEDNFAVIPETRIADFSLLFMKYQGIYFMKKTLIALTVAASAAISGSAMAWTPNGNGGSVQLSGMLTPDVKVTPWEVKVGDAVKGLDAKINKGQKTVDIAVTKTIPILGIRTQTAEVFHGQAGITPQISYGNAVKTDSFSKGSAPLTLEVKDSTGVKIGTAETSIVAAAASSYVDTAGHKIYSLYASKSGYGFFGGVGKSADAVASNPNVVADNILAEARKHYNNQGYYINPEPGQITFDIKDASYSAYYVSGIEKDKTIKITLDDAACGDAPIQWKASLPIIVSYM